MRISIITVCLNSEKTIAYTLYSVFHQTYKNIEHIFVDGGSSDNTLNIIKKHRLKKKIIKKKNLGIYSSINLGIKNCSGEYVLILHSDDILDNKYTIEKIVNKIKNKKKDIYLGNVSYFDGDKFNQITRFYSAQNFKLWHLIFGIIPPHTGCFIKSNIAKKYTYNPIFSIAADYDFFLRVFIIYKKNFEKIDLTVVRMRTGGTSGYTILTHLKTSLEIFKSRKKNKQFSSYILIYSRIFLKIKQFLFLKKSTNFKISNYYKKLIHYDILIIKNLKKIKFNKNFTLSALNLAFIGNYLSNEIKIYKNFFCWPDGIFINRLDKKLRKFPGRDLLKKIIIPKKIKITVIGNLNDISKKFLEKIYKRKIFHIDIIYASINNIIKKFVYKISKNELIFITLPTPKQEQLAEYLFSKNKFYKIICIGGSINIASGIEKKVPNFFLNYEFLWRLRNETIRRSIRLITSYLKYIIGKFYLKKFSNLTYKIVN